MNCSTCRVNKIGPKNSPFGGYLCGNEHLQCQVCNSIQHGLCGICQDSTKFVQMNFNTTSFLHMSNDQQAQLQVQVPMQAQFIATSLPSSNNMINVGISKNKFNESRLPSTLIMKEMGLSVKNSKVSLQHYQHELEAKRTVTPPPIEMRKMETLYEGCPMAEDSTSYEDHSLDTVKMTAAKTNSTSQRSATPPLICLSSTMSRQQHYLATTINERERQPECVFSKKFLSDLETQSQLSEEHLSMKDSKDSLNQNSVKTNGDGDGDGDIQNSMKTLYLGDPMPNDYSLSIIGNSFKNCTNISELSNTGTRKSSGQSTKASGIKKENIFTFSEDPNDSNVITAYGIRFISSADSLQNFYSNSKHDMQKTPINSGNVESQRVEQTFKGLSKKSLPQSEAMSSVDSRAKVEKYLKSYDPSKVNTPKVSPTYSCQHSNCTLDNTPRKSTAVLMQKTVSVSTESEPSLKSAVGIKPDMNAVGKFKPQEYLVMPIVAVNTTTPGISEKQAAAEKIEGKPSMDVRMQKVLETLQEQSAPELPSREEKKEENLIKIPQPAAAAAAAPAASVKPEQKHHKEDNRAALIACLINVQRACYNPPDARIKPVNNLHQLQRPQPVNQNPPEPQFQTINISSALIQELMGKRSKFAFNKPVPAYLLNIPRAPIQCPESSCQRMIFVSDFNKHLVFDHSHLPMERIIPLQCKNFFLDPRLVHCGISKCHLLYLMRNKVCDLGSSEYKDFLPILVMTTRLSLSQMCGLDADASELQYFLIWITGIALEEFPTSVSLTVWPRSGEVPSCHLVYSGQMYSIRNSQRGLDVWQSGRMLMLSDLEIDALTNHGRDMLNIQLIVH